MFEATRNQLANITNPSQGKSRKVLCVCSAGLLRSPTLANVLHKNMGYNTRACGTASNFALIPITEALIYWADEIVFVDEDCKTYLSDDAKDELRNCEAQIITLNIPDSYDYGDSVLEDIIWQQYLLTD